MTLLLSEACSGDTRAPSDRADHSNVPSKSFGRKSVWKPVGCARSTTLKSGDERPHTGHCSGAAVGDGSIKRQFLHTATFSRGPSGSGSARTEAPAGAHDPTPTAVWIALSFTT